jgi:hypothetical protein
MWDFLIILALPIAFFLVRIYFTDERPDARVTVIICGVVLLFIAGIIAIKMNG